MSFLKTKRAYGKNMSTTFLAAGTFGVGTSFRRQRGGPERALIDWFLGSSPVRVPSGCRMTIFQEPRLESGFPDLVIVFWRERRTWEWNPARAKLKSEDIRLLHFLHHNGPAIVPFLARFFDRSVAAQLDRLEEAKVAFFRSGTWRVRPLNKIFAVQQIIAIEAKIDDLRGGLHQAVLNTWFASNSYLLTPHVPRSEDFLGRASALGVGLWSRKRGIVQEPIAGIVPRSYASWLFNEWVWKAELSSRQVQVHSEHRHSLASSAVC
jgi:hypothetical protein